MSAVCLDMQSCSNMQRAVHFNKKSFQPKSSKSNTTFIKISLPIAWLNEKCNLQNVWSLLLCNIKGNKYNFRGNNSVKFVLYLFWKGVYSKRKEFALHGSKCFYCRFLLSRELIVRKPNRKFKENVRTNDISDKRNVQWLPRLTAAIYSNCIGSTYDPFSYVDQDK